MDENQNHFLLFNQDAKIGNEYYLKGKIHKIKDDKIVRGLVNAGIAFEPEDAAKQYKEKEGLNKLFAGNVASIISDKKREREITQVKSNVLELMAKGQRNDATEAIASYIEETEYIKTLRHDEKAEMYIYKVGIYIPTAKTYIQQICREILGQAFTTQIYSTVLSKIIADTYITPENFFKIDNVHKIAVENGILNTKTKTLESFDPWQYYFNKLPVTYDKDKDCPNIKKFFSQILKEDDLKAMQEIFGFLLLREYRFEKAVMFIGTGRNGKGKTIMLIKVFLGADNVSNIPIQQLESDLYSAGELVNKLANLSADISKSALKTTGQFKSLTGRDLISAPRKFLPRVNFVNYAKMIFCANELPITHDLTIAFFNRWILFEFPYTFLSNAEIKKSETNPDIVKIADENIIDALITPDELSGLLNWAVEGLERLLKQGDFTYSATTQDVKDIWLRKADSFMAFCMDNIKSNFDSKISKAELRKAYAEYCRKHKLRISSDHAVKTVLSETYGISETRIRAKDKDVTVWEGIEFVMGVMDDMGFSTLCKNQTFDIGTKTLGNHDTHGNLTGKVEEEPIRDEPTHHKCSECQNTPCHFWSKGKPMCRECHAEIIRKQTEVEQ